MAKTNNKSVVKKPTRPKKSVPAPAPKEKRKLFTATEPVKIIVEVIIRNETATPIPSKSFSFKASPGLLAEEGPQCPDNKFKFSFDKSTDVTILSIIVEDFKQDLPPDTGNFTTCILDPHDPPSITVAVLAKTENPGGRAALSLSFNGKEVYDKKELENKGHGKLGIMESVKLPA